MKQLASLSISIIIFHCAFGQCPNGGSLSGDELVANPHFNLGNSNFTSQYTYCNSSGCLFPEAYYAVGTNPNYFHSGFNGSDHTTGTGNLMVINGAGTLNVNVWCQTIAVNPYTTYIFSYWLSSMVVGSPAKLQVTFNGVLSGSIFIAPNSLYTWIQYSLAWNSGNNTSVDVCITNQNTVLGGNDFGLDDMSFQQCICSSNIIADAGPDVSICPGDSALLNASGGVGYSWSPSEGLSDSTINNPTASPASTTTYYVMVYDTFGCSAIDSTTVYVNLSPPIVLSNDTTICYGTSASLNASGGITYSWSPANGLSNTSSSNTIATPDSTSTYVVTVTDAQGCFGKDSVTVFIFPKPNITVSADTMICKYTPVNIYASGGVSYQWNTGATTNSIIVSLSVSTAYTVSVTDSNTCVFSSTINVSIDPPFLSTAGDDEICYGDSTLLTASGGTIYIWSNGTVNESIVVSPQANTLYQVAGYNGHCWDTVSLNVIVDPLPVADAGADVHLVLGKEISLIATGGNNCLWSPADYLSCVDCCNPIASPNDTTVYYVTVTNEFGCSDNDTVIVFVLPPDVVFIPDAFTPNGDGVNDIFLPLLSGETELTAFKIFNRWGQMIFYSTNNNLGWDGTFKSKPQPVSTYVYFFSGKNSETGEVIEMKGNVVLLK